MLREAVPGDREAVVELAELALGAGRAAGEAFAADSGEHVLVSVDNGLEGFLIYTMALGEAEVLYIAVSPEKRGRGVGTRLLEKLISLSNAVFLEVREGNAPAAALYEKCGFERLYERKGYYGNGENAVVMRRMKNNGIDTRN